MLKTRREQKRAVAPCALTVGTAICLSFTTLPAGAVGAALAASAVSSSNEGLREIVVTAQRRPENVQKSSLDIQVVSGDELTRAGVTTVKGLSAVVPGLQISYGGNETQAFIRGVGDLSSTGLGQTAVAFYFDGVYMSDQATYGPQFYDLARVEVLKGPQGTLYGQNSPAGAVNLITNEPTDKLSGNLTTEFGNYNLKHVTGAINVPLSSTLFVRGAFNYVSRSGYLSDKTDDDHQQSGRIEMLWKPNDRFSTLIVGDTEHWNGYGDGQVLLPTQPGTNKFTGEVNAVNNAAILAAAGPLGPLLALPGAGKNPLPFAPNMLLMNSVRDNTQNNIMGKFRYDFGFATLTFIPAYRSAKDYSFGYSPGFPFGDTESTHQQSYELRLSKTNKFMTADVGLYYFDEGDSINQFAIISPLIPPLDTQIIARLGTRSYAVFGQGTFHITHRFRLIGGLRYTDERKTIDGSHVMKPFGISPIIGLYTGNTTFTSLNFRAGAEYDLTPENMVYVTVSSGFKSGGFNTFQSAHGISNIYRPERLTSYVAGIRNRFLDNRLQVNVEGFYWDDKNSQQAHLTYDPSGNLQFETLNAAAATIYGADIDAAARVTRVDTVELTMELLHARFGKFIYDIPTQNYAPASVACGVRPSTNPGFTSIDCSNEPLPRAPDWAGTASYAHLFHLGGDGSVKARVSFSFEGSHYIAVDYIAAERDPANVRTNMDLTYIPENGHWSVAAFVRNLTNQAVYMSSINTPAAPGYVYATVDSPRTFGVRLTANF